MSLMIIIERGSTHSHLLAMVTDIMDYINR